MIIAACLGIKTLANRLSAIHKKYKIKTKEKTKMKNKKEKNMKENMKKKIRLIGLMTVLALSFSCAESNADDTSGPPAPTGPNLVFANPSVDPISTAPSTPFNFAVDIRNSGNGPSLAPTKYQVYRSMDAGIDSADDTEGTAESIDAGIAAGGTKSVTVPLTSRDSVGDYYYGICLLDANDDPTNTCSTGVKLTVIEPQPPGILVYVLGGHVPGTKKTSEPQLVPASNKVVEAEEGKELIFLVTTNLDGLDGLDDGVMVTYEFMPAVAGAPPATGSPRACGSGFDYEHIPNGVNMARKGLSFHFQTLICPDDMAEFDEEFQVSLSADPVQYPQVENSPFNIEVVIPNKDKALVSVKSIRQTEDGVNDNGDSANIEITLRNVGMSIPAGLIVNYEIRGVNRDGVDSVEAKDFVGGSFPSDKVTFPGVNTMDLPPTMSMPINFAQDSDSVNEEFEIIISLPNTNTQEVLNLVALANSRASGFILANVDTSTAAGCEPFSTTPREDAIPISTIEELQAINRNQFTRSRHYVLMNDIDASVTETWNGGAGFDPIGNYIVQCRAWDSRKNPGNIDEAGCIREPGGVWMRPDSEPPYCIINYRNTVERFTGSFDGNGKKISNLYINRPGESFIGLFGATIGASICKLGLVNVNFRGWDSVGGIAGWGALATNRLKLPKVTSKTACGKVAGGAWWPRNPGGADEETEGDCVVRNNLIRDTYVTGNIEARSWTAGGLLGRHDQGVIARSYSTANVTGGQFIGGLVGAMPSSASRLIDSYSSGTITGAGYVGGLIGLANGHIIARNYFSGKLTHEPGRVIPGHGVVLCTSMHSGCTTNMTPPAGAIMGFSYLTPTETRVLTSASETVTGWNPNVWGRLDSITQFPCIKDLPIYDNSGMLGDKSACQ